jgi:hypothetical protein
MFRTLVIGMSLPYEVAASAPLPSVRLALAQLAPYDIAWLQSGPLESAIALTPEVFGAVHDVLRKGLGSAASFGVAQAAASTEDGMPLGTRTLVRALLLARLAKSGQTMVHASALDLLDACSPEVHKGKIAGRTLRGRLLGKVPAPARQDERELAFVGDTDFKELHVPGKVGIVRADPGRGGTRILQEIQKQRRKSLLVSPSGTSHEPLGALRLALGSYLDFQGTASSESLRAMLSGDGVPHEDALAHVIAALGEGKSEQGFLLIDDASLVDSASLSVCAQICLDHRVALVVRLDATELLPIVLAAIPKASELDVCPLSHAEAMKLALSVLHEAKATEALQTVIEYAGTSPVGIVEAALSFKACGQLSELTAFRSDARAARKWFSARFRALPLRLRRALQLLALFGGNAPMEWIAGALELEPAQLAETTAALERELLIRPVRGRIVCLQHQSAAEWILEELHKREREQMHTRAAELLVERGRVLEVTEAVHHFSEAGEVSRAAEVCLLVARHATELGYDTSGLLALARELDPDVMGRTSEHANASLPVTLALLQEVLVSPHAFRSMIPDDDDGGAVPTALLPPKGFDARQPSKLPYARLQSEAPGHSTPAPGRRTNPYHGSPTKAGSGAPSPDAELGALASDALLSGNLEAAERWIDALSATAKSPDCADRLRGLVRIMRSDDGNALRILREVRVRAQSAERVFQADLALAYAYLQMGRLEHARLSGTSALLGAKGLNARAQNVCARLLGLIAEASGYGAEAQAIHARAVGGKRPTLRS